MTISSDILATKPDEQKKREDLYHSLLGIEGLLSFMQLQANAAAHIKSPKEPEDVTKEYAQPTYAFEETYDEEGFSVTPTPEENDY